MPEEIQDAAIVCKHCQRDLAPAVTTAPPKRSTARRFGPLAILVVVVTVDDFIKQMRAFVQAARGGPMSVEQRVALLQIGAALDQLEDFIASWVERIQDIAVFAVTGERPPEGPNAIRHKRDSKARRARRGGC